MNYTRIARIILIAVLVPSLAHCDDWRIAMYDAARQVFARLEQDELSLMVKLEPKISEFYTLKQPMDDAWEKMQRHMFIRRLQEEPDSIDWTNVWKWSQGSESTDQEIRFAENDPVIKSLRDDFLSKRKAIREEGRHDLFKMRNEIYESHCEQFSVLEKAAQERLIELQRKVDEILKGG